MKHSISKFCTTVLLAICILWNFVPVLNASDGIVSDGMVLHSIDSGLFILFPALQAGQGDCCIIKFGSKQILIDGGNSTNGDKIDRIVGLMRQTMDPYDKKWDYVIVTHGDADHLNGLATKVSESEDIGIISKMKKAGVTFDKLYDFDTVVDSQGNRLPDDPCFKLENQNSQRLCGKIETDAYEAYAARRSDSFKSKDYQTAATLCRGKEHSIYLGNKNGLSCKLIILYNYYYDHPLDETDDNPQEEESDDSENGEPSQEAGETSDSVKKNVVSVCVLLQYGNQSFLLTGDLPEYKVPATQSTIGKEKGIGPENLLIANNPSLKAIASKHNLTMLKAPHHGSDTASSENFVNSLNPRFVVMSATADGQYGFPNQNIMDLYLALSSKPIIAISDKRVGKNTEPYYGNIAIMSDGTDTKMYTTGEIQTGTEFSLLGTSYGLPMSVENTDWYIKCRLTLSVYFLDIDEIGRGHCTLLKYGNTEILIDCGIYSDSVSIENKMFYPDKLKQLCADEKIEYLIVTNSQQESITNLISTYKKKPDENNPESDVFEIKDKGVLDKYKIQQLIRFGETNESNPSGTSWLGRFYEATSEMKRLKSGNIWTKEINKHFSFTVWNLDPQHYASEDDYSLCVIADFFGEKLIFTGDLTNDEGAEKAFAEVIDSQYGPKVKVALFRAGNDGYGSSNSEELMKVIKPEYTVISGTLGLHTMSNSRSYPSVGSCQRIMAYTIKQNGTRNVYALSQIMPDGTKQAVCGDITFTLTVQDNNQLSKKLTGSVATIPLERTEWYQANMK